MDLYKVVKHIYPDLDEKDFVLKDDGDGPYILEWFAEITQPTHEELQTVWEQIKDIPIEKPKTQLEILQETVDKLVLDNLMRGV